MLPESLMQDQLSCIMGLRMQSKYSETFSVGVPQLDITGLPGTALKRLCINIYVILIAFKCVSCTLVPVVCVIYTFSKTNQNVVREFCNLFWRIGSCFCKSLSCFIRSISIQKSLAVAIYYQIKSRNCQRLVKIYSLLTDILQSRLLFFYYCTQPERVT